MQSAEVSRPILSVIRLTESGKEATFRKNGGTIRDPKTGMTTEFQRKHGVYILPHVGPHREASWQQP